MATKEDILEQIVEEYLVHQGYFVQHNIKFLPRKDHPDFALRQDSNHSDIDVLAIHPKRTGPAAVMAVSCKSWQSGFNPASELKALAGEKKIRGKKAWQSFRELCVPKWSEAFRDAVKTATGSETFTYGLAVTHLKGDRHLWERHAPFIEALGGNPIQVLTFRDMVTQIHAELDTTLAATEVGRMLQLFRAAGIAVS